MVLLLTNSLRNPGGRTPPGVEFGKRTAITIALVIIFCYSSLRPINAQTLTPIPSPTPTLAATDTPAPTATPAPSATVTPAPPVQAPTIQADISPTPTPEIPSPLPIINTVNISTASAAQANILNMQNTTASGGQPTIINITSATNGTMVLDQPPPCTATSSALPAFINNSASIQNSINASSITGANPNASGQTTENASATVNVFNMANTTLSGSCWHFQVLNFFAPHTGDVILPKYQDFVNPSASTMKPAAVEILPVQNTANVTNSLNATADTGSSVAANITTGNATASIQSQNVLNTTIAGDNWLLLTIRSFGGWDGALLNWPGNIFSTPQETVAFIPISAGGTYSSTVKNRVDVTNIINANASSGANLLSGDLITGSAQAFIRLFNLLNTTISGNNWYFGYITIFDSFHGNIMFPAPTPTTGPKPMPQAVTVTAVTVSTPAPTPTSMPALASLMPTPEIQRYVYNASTKPPVHISTPLHHQDKPKTEPKKGGNPILFTASTTVMATTVEIYRLLRGKIASRRNRSHDFS